MRSAVRGATWIAVYLGVAVAPLLLSLIDLEPGRGFLVNLSVALGFVGLSMIGLQFALVARVKPVSRPFGIDLLLQFHRQISYIALTFIVAHPVLLFVRSSRFLGLLDFPQAPWRARFAVIAVLGMFVLIALSLWRRRLRISYEAWQATHAALAIVVAVTALTHVLLVGYYVDEPWEKALWILMSAAFVALLLWVRVLRPLQRSRHAWRVAEVRPERGHSATVVLEPSNGRDGKPLTFEPGQFAWIMAGQSPFAVTQHPFSFSSSAEDHREVSVTIRTAGDFTYTVENLQTGATVYLDGPYGAFTIDRHEGPGFVFIGGGIGITPIMSMLRTLRDRGDVRPCHVFACNHDRESAPLLEALEFLAEQGNVTLVHVLNEPGGPLAAQGPLDVDTLRQRLPKRYEHFQYFVCGPTGLMDAMEQALTELGVPDEHIHSERFAMV